MRMPPMTPLPCVLPLELPPPSQAFLELHGDRALHWPARGRLVIADLHLGKGDAFRRAGIGLPAGGTEADLDRLGRLLDRTAARSLWITGDLLHGPLRAAAWLDRWRAWRANRPDLDVAVVPGNHDRSLEAGTLAVRRLDACVIDGPLAFCHDPADAPPDRFAIVGHLHPTARPGRTGRRWPAFLIGRDRLVLPAFSAFTGGPSVTASADARVVLCVEGGLVALPR